MAEAAGLNPVQRGFDPRRGYWFPAGHGGDICLQDFAGLNRGGHPTYNPVMSTHGEEEPEDPDEPDEPGGPDNGAMAPTRMVPTVGLPGRDWEFSTQVLTVAQVADGTSLVKVLKESGADGWELAQVIDGGDKRVLLLRRPKRPQREARRVGFAPPSEN